VHVVVVGCGRVGSSLALELVQAGHSVAVIDRNPDSFRRLTSGPSGEAFGGTTVQGVGFDRDRLVEAGIERADAVAAVTSGDNSNILVARVARETFQVRRVVARIYDPRRAAIYERLGIATVASVAWATERVLRRILPDADGVEWIDPSANVTVLERTVPAALAGRTIASVEQQVADTRVIALSRNGAAEVPRPDAVLQDGDVVFVATVDTDFSLTGGSPS
jgi:trk system potassium uptake protein TrkA